MTNFLGDTMTYQALYRQFRPQTFSELTGQPNTVRTLQNALERKSFPHAYLFSGPRGTGKTSAAKILAKALNCESGPAREPCNNCHICRGITEGRIMDVLEIDAASNRGIEEIRDLRDKVRYAPTETRYKVYIIDEVHMLTQEASNALLKTLEEPPAQVIFILATTEPHKLPATILSRCQRHDFRLIGLGDMVERLRTVAQRSGISVSDGALHRIAEEANGGLRDALSLLEQAHAYAAGQVSEDDVLGVLGAVSKDVLYNLAESLKNNDLASSLRLIAETAQSGRDLYYFTQQVIGYFRDLMVVAACGQDTGNFGLAPDWNTRISPQAQALGMGKIARCLSVFHNLLAEIRWSNRPRLLWELAIFELLVPVANHVPAPRREESGARASTDPAPPVAVTEKKTDTPVAGGGGEQSAPGSLNRLWARIMQEIKKEDIRIHAHLLNAEPVSLNNEKELVVRFNSSFSKEAIEETKNRIFTEKMISQIMGRPTVIRCFYEQDGNGNDEKKNDNPLDLVQTAVELFNGKIIE